MRLASLRRSRRLPDLPGLSGTARIASLPAPGTDSSARESATRALAGRSRLGDIALIDHLDLDQVSAQALVSSGVSAVLNAAPSISGRYPNLGPQVLVGAGVVVIDAVGPELTRIAHDGEALRVEGDTVFRGETPLAAGTMLTPQSVIEAMETARKGLATQLEVFTANAAEHLRRERDLLLDGTGIPATRTRLSGRPVLVVVAGAHWQEDLRILRHWIAEAEPVLIGVDGGADALRHARYRPDIVVGDLTSVSDDALTDAREVVLHVARDGRAPGRRRVEDLGVDYIDFPATATAEDLALLLADAGGAQPVVLAGSRASLTDLVDGGRDDMASAFLVRMRLGGRLAEARAVAAVHTPRPSVWPLIALMVLAVVALGVLLYVVGPDTLHDTTLGQWWREVSDSVQSWFGGSPGSADSAGSAG